MTRGISGTSGMPFNAPASNTGAQPSQATPAAGNRATPPTVPPAAPQSAARDANFARQPGQRSNAASLQQASTPNQHAAASHSAPDLRASVTSHEAHHRLSLPDGIALPVPGAMERLSEMRFVSFDLLHRLACELKNMPPDQVRPAMASAINALACNPHLGANDFNACVRHLLIDQRNVGIELKGAASLSDDAERKRESVLGRLAHCTTLQSLDIRMTGHQDDSCIGIDRLRIAVQHIAAANPTLKHLYINAAESGINPASVGAFATIPNITALNVDGIPIGDSGIKALATSRSLVSLKASRAAVTNDGARALAQMVSLRHVWLDGNHIDLDGALGLLGHPALKTVSLRNNPMDDADKQILADRIRRVPDVLDLP